MHYYYSSHRKHNIKGRGCGNVVQPINDEHIAHLVDCFVKAYAKRNHMTSINPFIRCYLRANNGFAAELTANRRENPEEAARQRNAVLDRLDENFPPPIQRPSKHSPQTLTTNQINELFPERSESAIQSLIHNEYAAHPDFTF